MICNVNSVWILTVLFFKILATANLQFEMPMYAPGLLPPPGPMFPPSGPMFPPPLPSMPMMPPLFPIAVPVSSEEKTTTTEKPKKKTFQMIFPAFPINRDVKRKKKPLIATPIVAPAPPSFVLVPPAIPRPIFQRRKPRKKLVPVYSSESTDSSSSSECYMTRRHRKRRRPNKNRRIFRNSENDDQLLKPMLSYVSDNGDIKFETKISNDDVAHLLGKDRAVNDNIQNVQVYTKDNESNNQKMIVVSRDKGLRGRTFGRYKKVLLRDDLSNHVLSEGRKELIFRPPVDKKISNLSVSFNVS